MYGMPNVRRRLKKVRRPTQLDYMERTGPILEIEIMCWPVHPGRWWHSHIYPVGIK